MNVILLFLIFFLNLSCSEKLKEVVHPGLLYVQEVNKGEGIHAGRFGEIMVYDIVNNKPRKVLSDKYFNVKPGWKINGEEIYFESKRGKNFDYVHLSVDSEIYTYNVNNRQLNKLWINYKTINEFIYMDEKVTIRTPFLVNQKYLSIFYSYYKVEKNQKTVTLPELFRGTKVIDLTEDLIIFNHKSGINETITKTTLNCQGDYLAIYSIPGKGSVIKVFDLKNQDQKSSLEYVVIDGEKGEYLSLGQWDEMSQAFLISIYKEDGANKISKFASYNPATDSIQTLFQIDSLSALNPVKYGEYVYFIGTKNHIDYDIYSFDLENVELQQLTFDTLLKTDLSGPNVCE